ncbi:hypothetical protein GAO09_03220 [Rhizobiales bacterium RZME27]|uniref:Glucosamine inositolphosphorylceramide transferase 1 N-terminal domain-containing protein n=1 Tax=Endobacterium cereale TaxID=2663029 RepID=A0A6A8A649_9HYPH|nr:hypothetical protein [Endobacterium cereale]MEB2844605.1 hypothetical protein [Endobacterium cereale]MQY45080.1 hypothetical protein [Endobacterium cereale]
MKTLLLIGHAANARLWEHELLERLGVLNCAIGVSLSQEVSQQPYFLDAVLNAEARKFDGCLALAAPPLNPVSFAEADLVINLTGGGSPQSAASMLTLSIAGAYCLGEGLCRLRTVTNSAPEIVARVNGQVVAVARPMLGDRVWLSRDCNDVLVSCQNLIISCVKRFFAGKLEPVPEPVAPTPSRPFLIGYGRDLLQGLASRGLRKLKPGSKSFYWQTGYRLIDGAGIAQSRKLDGPPFMLLPDDGNRFYADPFAFDHKGRSYLFVEEFPYALGRGIISVTELKPDGSFDPPRRVLEEPHHLSYPNVFQHEGSIFMIPESGGANEVVLYRAEEFPDRWVRDTVILEARCFNDATLLEHGGKFWMFGTERFGGGSASDTLMVYSAANLRGPWQPHPLNPILIDRAGARPGGNFIQIEDRTFLPVQDGTLKYGGGLGLREVMLLNDEDVVLGEIAPIASGPAWHGAGIHTLTRSGRLETIDSSP